MYKNFLALFLLISGLVVQGNAQSSDTLTVMHYNLLNYGNFTSFCTSNNNNLNTKDADLETVVKYVQPDIFTANEIGASPIYLLRILNNSLNTQGVSYYSGATYTNTANSDLVNGFFYNSQKLGLLHESVVTTAASVRDINLYKMYHKPSVAGGATDTVFLSVLVAHLKAGNSSGDAAVRATETAQVMAYLNAQSTVQNYLMAGDFNVYTSNEAAFQNLIAPTSPQRFYDPINQLGGWSNNSFFAPVHTQSTSASSGCKAAGGMDDRFDFILANDHVINDSAGVTYIPGSYEAIGQDGLRFNQSIISPGNASVPSNVVVALSRMSDHLPVKLKLAVSSSVTSLAGQSILTDKSIQVQNPFSDNLKIFSKVDSESYKVNIYSLDGRLQQSATMRAQVGEQTLNTSWLARGAYIVHFLLDDGRVAVRKVIKN